MKWNLPEKELRVMTVKMIQGIRKRMKVQGFSWWSNG